MKSAFDSKAFVGSTREPLTPALPGTPGYRGGRVSRVARLALIGSIALLLSAGCNYQAGGAAAFGDSNAASDEVPVRAKGYQWKGLYPENVRTVAVPIFSNRSFRQGVEFRLTQAIVKQLEADTPYKVVPAEHADTVLEGEITDISLRTISSDAHVSVPQEQLYRVRVNFVWKDLRSGRILVQRRRFEQMAPFYPTLGEGQFIGSQLNVERLALGIVQELQADW